MLAGWGSSYTWNLGLFVISGTGVGGLGWMNGNDADTFLFGNGICILLTLYVSMYDPEIFGTCTSLASTYVFI